MARDYMRHRGNRLDRALNRISAKMKSGRRWGIGLPPPGALKGMAGQYGTVEQKARKRTAAKIRSTRRATLYAFGKRSAGSDPSFTDLRYSLAETLRASRNTNRFYRAQSKDSPFRTKLRTAKQRRQSAINLMKARAARSRGARRR